jgi:hypothetical protein
MVKVPNLRTFGLIWRGLGDYSRVLPIIWFIFFFHMGLDISFGGLWRRLPLDRPRFVHWVTSYVVYFIGVSTIWAGWILTYSIDQRYYLRALSLFIGFGSNLDVLYIFYEAFTPIVSTISFIMLSTFHEVHFLLLIFLIGFVILGLLSLLLFLFPIILFYTGYHLSDLVQRVTYHFHAQRNQIKN